MRFIVNVVGGSLIIVSALLLLWSIAWFFIFAHAIDHAESVLVQVKFIFTMIGMVGSGIVGACIYFHGGYNVLKSR